ncbi:transcriptional regulator [Sphingomonas sp. HMWF008]|nr:transcriptional regulator [Sphingomonas sp. HMWF008]
MSNRTATPLSDALERGDVLSPHCPSRVILNHVTSKWGVLTLLALRSGTLRFSALRRKVSGVSERMLAQTLQQLEGCRLVDRHSYAEVPPRVDYTLTPLGHEAAERVAALANWIEASLPLLLECASADA